MIATPVLSLLGVPGLLAIASPLPATIPSAIAAAVPYNKAKTAHPRAAAWSLAGGLPATVAGALLSTVVGGPALLIVSGIVLIAVGLRITRPVEADSASDTAPRPHAGRPTVRVADGTPGDELQVDFGRLGLIPDPFLGGRRVTHGLIFTAVYSRHMFVYPTHRQTLARVRDVVGGVNRTIEHCADELHDGSEEVLGQLIVGAHQLRRRITAALLAAAYTLRSLSVTSDEHD